MRHVLDLVPLYQRPSSDALLEALGALAVRPATFDGRASLDEGDDTTVAEEGVPRYLTSIIGSPLAWIEDEAARETVWELASQRLSERSGRTAQPSFQRSFKISQGGSPDVIEIQLHEPSLTEDNLGHKTWAAAYLLAKRLPSLLPLLPALEDERPKQDGMTGQVPRVLELGAGTGLTGLALAMLVPCSLHLTDLPAIVPNLASNAALNEPALARQQARSSVSSFVLDWSQLPSSVIAEDEQYDMVLAADPLYSPEHPGWLVQAIVKYLRRTQGSRLIIELPLREAYVKERTVLWHGLESEGLVLFEHGEETGFDDWGNGGTEVDCWWGVWGWKS